MFLCSKKTVFCKIVTKSGFVTKKDVTKSGVHCTKKSTELSYQLCPEAQTVLYKECWKYLAENMTKHKLTCSKKTIHISNQKYTDGNIYI